MAALPYMQLYVADYLADTAHLKAIEHGAYLLLIMNYWQTGKPLNNANERLTNVARMSKEEWNESKKTLQEFFKVDGDTWTHLRIEADLFEVNSKATKARKNTTETKESNRPLAHVWRVIRSRIFKRDDYTCRYCGERGKKLECDHVIPVSRGGMHEDDNLVTACFACNRSKRDKLVSEWRGI